MIKFILGVIVGVVITTIGFQGVVNMGDKAVTKIKSTSVELAK